MTLTLVLGAGRIVANNSKKNSGFVNSNELFFLIKSLLCELTEVYIKDLIIYCSLIIKEANVTHLGLDS